MHADFFKIQGDIKKPYHFLIKGSDLVGVIKLVKNAKQINQEASRSILVESFIGEYEKYLSPQEIDDNLTSWRDGDKSVQKYYEDYFVTELDDFSHGNLHYWVEAYIDGALVGWVTFQREKSEKNAVYMNLLIVHPAHQKKGIGEQLVKSLITLQEIPNLSAIHLLLIRKNLGGKIFYPKIGFSKNPKYNREDNFVNIKLLEGWTWRNPLLQHQDTADLKKVEPAVTSSIVSGLVDATPGEADEISQASEVKYDAIKQESMDKKVSACAGSAFRLQMQGKYQEAINRYLRVLSYHEKHAERLSRECMILLNNIACAYRDLGQYGNAISFFKKLIDHDEQHGISTNKLAEHYEKVAICFKQNNVNGLARECREKALQLYRINLISNAEAIVRIEKYLGSDGAESKIEAIVADSSIASAASKITAETKISDYRCHIFAKLSSSPEKLRRNDEPWQETYNRHERLIEWMLFNLKTCPKEHQRNMVYKFQQEQPDLDRLSDRLGKSLNM